MRSCASACSGVYCHRAGASLISGWSTRPAPENHLSTAKYYMPGLVATRIPTLRASLFMWWTRGMLLYIMGAKTFTITATPARVCVSYSKSLARLSFYATLANLHGYLPASFKHWMSYEKTYIWHSISQIQAQSLPHSLLALTPTKNTGHNLRQMQCHN